MIDQLQIKCPSCGIILEVRNSKHEAVKQITCPNCQKHLAVNFEEEEKPASLQPIIPIYYGEMRIDLQEGVNQIPLPDCDFVEIKVVRLKDGNTKCLVHALNVDHSVLVNGTPLGKDDEIVLAEGDQLQIDKTCLSFCKSGSIVSPPPEPPASPKSVTPQQERNRIWFYAALAFVALTIVTILIWPFDKQPELPAQTSQSIDSVKNLEPISKPKAVIVPDKPTKKVEESGKKVTTNKDITKLSDYELEKLALNGNTEAQFEIGNRLVHRSGPSTVVRGIKYLRMASQNGSSKARDVLIKAVNTLKQRAEHGDSISYYILESI